MAKSDLKERMRYLLIACLGAVFGHSCNAYETLYNRDDSDLRWLYDNQLYGHGFRDSEFNGNFDDYVPSSYRKSLHYPPIVSYHPRAFYDDTRDQVQTTTKSM
ncbi:hypothetical protein Bhyg_05352 [Pseudolycoriella hygida]|uniref:Uncharacterized protein n=1 Tax=Pseudolycoriella hygida TaxID=35572 RepID=A0A9Q0SA78_9DIPT|nr:hypothetical protein Bhyg_05352 [Pseudolycoriella hygida]